MICRSFILEHDDLIVSVGDVAIDIQLVLAHKAFLHQSQEWLLILLLVLVFLLARVQLLFLIEHVDSGVGNHGHLHGERVDVYLGIDPQVLLAGQVLS